MPIQNWKYPSGRPLSLLNKLQVLKCMTQPHDSSDPNNSLGMTIPQQPVRPSNGSAAAQQASVD
jgi:hypothetical protein